ncbi:MAG: lipid-A-disaccharide synthase [Deltaproteobacteria bacterium]|nr:lipid-A-disaccharide synthase [Deltaproteobacteria bacterium]
MSEKMIRSDRPKRVLIIAGEASGDLHGANLVRAVHRVAPRVGFYGIGGENLRSAGAQLLFHNSQLALVGISEVLPKLRSILLAFGRVKRSLVEEDPDLAVLIDFPDFNLHMAGHLKRRGIPILYYISPQIWAWRGWRINKIRKLVDRMVVVLPFEPSFYGKRGVEVSFLGHPLLDVVKPSPDAARLLRRPGVGPGSRVIGLFPGSRDQEVHRLLPVMLDAASLMVDQGLDLHFLVALAPDIDPGEIGRLVEMKNLSVGIVENRPYDVMAVSEVLLVASGTVTLEAAILNTPMVILYRVSPLTYWIGRMMARVDHIGLVNLVAGTTVAPELIQGRASADMAAREVISILEDVQRCSTMKSALAEVREKLGTPGASDRVARLVLEMIDGEKG